MNKKTLNFLLIVSIIVGILSLGTTNKVSAAASALNTKPKSTYLLSKNGTALIGQSYNKAGGAAILNKQYFIHSNILEDIIARWSSFMTNVSNYMSFVNFAKDNNFNSTSVVSNKDTSAISSQYSQVGDTYLYNPNALPSSYLDLKKTVDGTFELTGNQTQSPTYEPNASPTQDPIQTPSPTSTPDSSPTPTPAPIAQSFPISLYNGETDVTFNSGKWGDITAAVVPEGIGGTNCIKYSNMINNPYSPGPEIIFSSPKNISGMVDSDRLQLIMDIGTVPTSQAARIIFNGDSSLCVVTPKLNKTTVFEILNLDISSIRAQLGGYISKISIESAGPNGWEHVNNLYIKEISIIRPTAPVPTIAPVSPPQLASDSLPISIYHDESNITFNPAHWGSITGTVSNEGIGGTNCIKYTNLNNNVYAPSPEAVFANPINISSMVSSDRFQISLNLGNTSPSQAVRIIFNGDPSLNIVTPNINSSSGFVTLNLDISGIREKLGGQIAQISFESAGPNGWAHVNNLYVDEISIVRP